GDVLTHRPRRARLDRRPSEAAPDDVVGTSRSPVAKRRAAVADATTACIATIESSDLRRLGRAGSSCGAHRRAGRREGGGPPRARRTRPCSAPEHRHRVRRKELQLRDRLAGGYRGLAKGVSRLLDVSRDLRRELGRACETQLVAQTPHKFTTHAIAVDLAAPVEEICLELPLAAAERRTDAEARRGFHALSLDLGPHGVDAVTRQETIRRDAEVHRRESKRAPALAAVLDDAGDPIGPPQPARGVLDVSREERVANAGRAHDLSIERHGLREIADETVRLPRSEEHTSELQSRVDLVCRLLLEKKKE